MLQLALDERVSGDDVAWQQPWMFLLDEATKQVTGDELALDYVANVGYILANAEQVLAYGLRLASRP